MKSKVVERRIDSNKKRFGRALFHEERKTIVLFADFVLDGRIERNALKHTYDSRAMRFLLSASKKLLMN